jgi:hypothetical protein
MKRPKRIREVMIKPTVSPYNNSHKFVIQSLQAYDQRTNGRIGSINSSCVYLFDPLGRYTGVEFTSTHRIYIEKLNPQQYAIYDIMIYLHPDNTFINHSD